MICRQIDHDLFEVVKLYTKTPTNTTLRYFVFRSVVCVNRGRRDERTVAPRDAARTEDAVVVGGIFVSFFFCCNFPQIFCVPKQPRKRKCSRFFRVRVGRTERLLMRTRSFFFSLRHLPFFIPGAHLVPAIHFAALTFSVSSGRTGGRSCRRAWW